MKFLRTRLGRIVRDIRRKIEGNTVLEDRFGPLLYLALRIRHQGQRQRGPKVYSLHAPDPVTKKPHNFLAAQQPPQLRVA